ncbi:MAG: uracil-DNA glycosylase [Clostridia bacterium]|nr:uracil-DNA glycosylase [Clostridia bacterium]
MPFLGNDWDQLLAAEWEKPYFKDLQAFLDEEYATQTVYPPRDEVFTALRLTSFADTRVVILGQDPYHGAGQAHGLSFSVKDGVALPRSLRNIFKELEADLGITPPSCGNLVRWAKEGVLLLNTVLTVREGEAASHQNRGWEQFTDAVIDCLDQKSTPVVFLLWGGHAQKRAVRIQNPLHVKLSSAHPSPLSASRGFFGCRHFSRTNAILKENGMKPINW